MKTLTELANNPDHCRQVWELITGYNSVGVSFLLVGGCVTMKRPNWPLTIDIYSDGLCMVSDGGRNRVWNPFTLVSLLTQLGYAPTEA